MRHHRAKYDLLGYAEALVDGSPVSVTTAGHVASCSVCRSEVEAIRASLTATGTLPVIDAPADLTARILQAAATERRNVSRGRRYAAPVRLMKAMAYAATLVVATAVCFSAVLGEGGTPATPIAPFTTVATRPSDEDVRQTAVAVTKLASAVNLPPSAKATPKERESRFDVAAREIDLRAGLAALAKNPGNPRANQVVRSNLNRQAKALKTLYVEQSL